jgi:hypothetical protein
MTPRNVKVLFDDSPWARVVESLKVLKSGGGMLPSNLILPSGRLKGASLNIRRIATEKVVFDEM